MQLTAVHDLLQRPGPFVTVHADVGRATEDAPQQLEARWTTVRHALEHEQVGAGLVSQIGSRLHERPAAPGDVRRTLVAAGDELVFAADLAGPTRWPEGTDVGPLPDLAPWVAQADRQVPFALVVADRTGAEISFHDGLAVSAPDDRVVEGEDFGVTKVPEGDWKQSQYQRAAENTWKENAGDVAAEVRRGLSEHRPEVVVLAGDVRARGLVLDALEGVQVPVVQVEAGGRAPGASDDVLWDEVRRILAEVEARRDEEVIAQLHVEDGHRAASGLDVVLDAMVQGQVERLVVDLDRARELVADTDQHPGLELPGDASGLLPADRVLLAAAARTGAEVSVIPAEETGASGVDAVLRWT